MSQIPFVDLKTQQQAYWPEIEARMQSVLAHGQFILGPEVAELERALEAFCGGGVTAVGVSDGTTALQIAMMALGIQPGDEIITSPFTFIATAETISLLGAKPVFVDIDPLTFNLAPAGLESAISKRTRAIIPVSLYGQCSDMSAIAGIASAHRMTVIEDAAQSFGARQQGKHSCTLSLLATTSFFPSKPLGCFGDGGACFSTSPELAERMSRIRAHGQSSRYRHVEIGLNGRLDTLQAAILLAKLPHLAAEIAARERAAITYGELILAAGLERDGVVLPQIQSGNQSTWAQYTIRVPRRDTVRENLSGMGIPTAVHYPIPLHRQPIYANQFEGKHFPCAEAAAAEVLSLPMHPFLEHAVQERVINALRIALRA